MLEIPAATIRNWEDRYGAIVPERSPGGHRLYSRDQMEQLRFIAAEVARGLSAADAHRLLSERAGGQPSADDRGAGATRLLVLLAERDPVAADLAQFFLRTEGYEVHLALAVGDAEEQWLESQPQLAIVELMISGGRGAELCRRLKQHEAGAVLAISVLQARDEALAAGADAFLQKPLDPLEFVSTVKDLLGASALVTRHGQERALMEERGTSGDEGLDLILGGGLPANGINLIMGLPGSGKTLLCQQFMFARATEERPAIYLSTVSEPFEKILRYAQTLRFFDRDAIGRSVFYEDLGPAVAGADGLDAVTQRIAALIKERRPGIIAIDSFKALAAFADDARAFRTLPARAGRTAHRLPRHQLLDRRIQRGRDAIGTGVRRRRRDHLARDRACERAHATPDPGDQAARERLPLGTARISPLRERHHRLPPTRRSHPRRCLQAER